MTTTVTKTKRRVKLRPAVLRFAEAMERTLRRHDNERGEEGWWDEGYDYLLERIDDELAELRDVLRNFRTNTDRKRAAEEAVDVGNFAMMMFDVALTDYQSGRRPT